MNDTNTTKETNMKATQDPTASVIAQIEAGTAKMVEAIATKPELSSRYMLETVTDSPRPMVWYIISVNGLFGTAGDMTVNNNQLISGEPKSVALNGKTYTVCIVTKEEGEALVKLDPKLTLKSIADVLRDRISQAQDSLAYLKGK